MRTTISCTFAAAITVSSAVAHAEECDVGIGDVGMGFVLPMRGCDYLLHGDVTFGSYFDVEGGSFLRGSTELGLLRKVGGPGARWHLGPVAEFGFAGLDDDFGGPRQTVQFGPRLKLRYWLPVPDDMLVFDAALGPSVDFSDAPAVDNVARVGGYADVGIGGHGLAGLFVAAEYFGPRDDMRLGSETRVVAGVRMTTGALLAIGMAALCLRAGGC
jgi:hypothetical protein